MRPYLLIKVNLLRMVQLSRDFRDEAISKYPKEISGPMRKECACGSAWQHECVDGSSMKWVLPYAGRFGSLLFAQIHVQSHVRVLDVPIN